MAQATKLIITDRTRMRAKYGQSGWTKIRAAVRTLIAADRARGIATKVVLIDGATAAAVKQRVDAAFATATPPDYVMLLGAPDVLAQARLPNPLWTGDPNDDPDQFVDSDLPYACDAPLGPATGAYRGPSRVVGRLPDLMGATKPEYLVGLIKRAARWKSVLGPRPLDVLAISTKTWRRSTQTSIAAIGGAAGPVVTCPPDGPNWQAPQMNRPLVFVNCHGGEFDPTWYGEQTAGQVNLPHAVEAGRLHGIVRPGSVVAAECCYGSMHWNPAQAGGQAGVAATLLAEGAVGVFAASTVAYGPPVGNSGADIITRMFLETVVAGGSLGRAALDARQRFVAHAVSLDPVDLKTLAQFDLLGDPSVHPIAAPVTDGLTPVGSAGQPPPGVSRRRATLRSAGGALETTIGATDQPRARASISRRRFAAAARLSAAEMAGLRIRSFDVLDQGPVALGATSAAVTPERYHVAFAGSGRRRSVIVVRTEPGAAPSARRLGRKA